MIVTYIPKQVRWFISCWFAMVFFSTSACGSWVTNYDLVPTVLIKALMQPEQSEQVQADLTILAELHEFKHVNQNQPPTFPPNEFHIMMRKKM